MNEQQAAALIESIQNQKTEQINLEIKEAGRDCPKIYDTLSSFSNQDEGGIILFGMSEKKGHEITGVYNAADLQVQINNKSLEMEPVVRPLLSVFTINGKQLVTAEIKGIPYVDRPVYHKKRGIQNGSYIRIGESDEHMTSYEIYKYQAYKEGLREDQRLVEAGWIMPNENLLRKFINRVKESRRFEGMSEEQILSLQKVIKNDKPTLAGFMVFSEYPQSEFPGLAITATVVPGTSTGETSGDHVRFLDNQRIEGSILEMLDESLEFVRRNMKTRTIVDRNGKRADKTEYPVVAIREAILNTLIHRDYSRHTDGTPIDIRMFTDRIEITSSGGIYGGFPVSQLGRDNPESRNSSLVRILEILKISENRYSGIPTMENEMKEYGLMPPEYIDNGRQFKIIFRNSLNQEDFERNKANQKPLENLDLSEREIEILEYCRTPLSRKEITEKLGMNYAYVVNKIIKPLMKRGLLIESEKRGKTVLLKTEQSIRDQLKELEKD